jgi:ATP-dependent helicase/nuclease subunit A
MSREAVEFFDQNIAVSAGAGSGKTTLLVERFLFAVTEKKFEPERILAITFTEKAANEMKARLIAQCGERGLDHLRQRLENSAISTIHSFCARLLRENPIESGVDPFFQILPEAEAELVMEKVMDVLFEAQVRNEGWLRILGDYGEEAIRLVFKKFYALSRALPAQDGLFGALEMAGEKKEIETRIGNIFKSAPQEWKDKPDFEVLLRIFSKPATADWETVRKVTEAASSLHKRGAHKGLISDLKNLCQEWCALAAQELGRPVKEMIAGMFSRFKEAYEKEKELKGSYDFEDLAFLAYRLLSGQAPRQKAVRRRLQEFFSCILVDEYQDTSLLQARLIGLLSKDDNLFVVGDVQQSIYGFRYAEPEVFKEALSGKKIVLRDNYRSRPEILRWINRFFAGLFPEGSFEPLCPKGNFSPKKDPSIELLCVPRDKELCPTLDKARVVEAGALARRLRQLAAEGFKYRDIAILFRSTTSLSLYEKELKEAGIPYFALKSRGFYERPEIVDALNFLRLVENPNQDIALAGVLRSPWVLISDDALFWMARLAKQSDSRAPLAAALGQLDKIPQLKDRDRQKLLDFSRFLEELRENKNRLTISAMIELILARTHAKAKVLVRPEGRQKLANLKKLVELARSVERRNVLGIEDFVFFLKSLSEREILEPQARLEESAGDGVTLLTVHAAKGLEFGCVIVADMGAQGKKNQRGPILALEEWGMGLRLRSPMDGQWFKDMSYQRIERHLSEKESAENDRLLYVAMTRAKERLIFSGCLKWDEDSCEGMEASSWMGQVAGALGLNQENQASPEMDWDGIRVKILQAKELNGCRFLETEAPPAAVRISDEKKFIQELKDRLKPVLREYPESWDRTVSRLWEAWVQSQNTQKLVLELEKKPALEEVDEVSAPANEFGTIFHKLMELTVKNRIPKIPLSFFNSPWTQGLSPEQKKRLRQDAFCFWKSPLGLEVRGSKKRYAELPFIYKTPHGILKGQIDLVFQNSKGEWVILDYKTNQIDAAEKDFLAQKYSFQMGLYAVVFKKLYGAAPAKGTLYFSSVNEPHDFVYKEKDFEVFEKMLDFWFLFCKNESVLGGALNGEDRTF